MQFIYYALFLIFSFLLIRSAFFKKQKMISRILIFVAFLMLWFIITIIGFVLLWNSGDAYNNQPQKMIAPEEIRTLNESSVTLSDETIIAERIIIDTTLTFEEQQKILRKRLLDTKPNENIKASVLQELYIKGLVNQIQDSIVFELPFNLHSFDCGAPDCYTTDILFKIPASTPIEFPAKINFTQVEHGCGIDGEIIDNTTFELIEQSTEYLNYYSSKKKSNLIILGKERELYYFTDVDRNAIRVNLIDKIMNDYDDDDPEDTAPYQSTLMRHKDYMDFMTYK